MSVLRNGLKYLLIGCAVFAVTRFCHKKTGEFERYKICSTLAPDPAWAVEKPSSQEQDQLRELFSQPFHFLGKGGQCFAFASADGRYVLKFFRLSRLTPPLWLLPFPQLFKTIREGRAEKLKSDFSSYLTAWKELREETGLLFCHLNKTDFLHQRVTLYDKIGVRHVLELDQMEFILQERAELFYPHLHRLEGEEQKRALHHFVTLLKQRYEKGILDRDPNLRINFGFVGEKAIQIDIGRFEKCPEHKRSLQDELCRITAPLRTWLEKEHPSLVAYLDQEVARTWQSS